MTGYKGRRPPRNRHSVTIGHLKRSACPTGKITYPSEAAAYRALKRVHPYEDGQKVPIRYYCCNLCREWHLTSAELRVEGGGNYHY